MPTSLHFPTLDPTPIFEHFRGSYGSDLLTAAVAHFRLFDLLHERPRDFDGVRAALTLESRPTHMLLTALRAMQLIQLQGDGMYDLTPMSRQHLVTSAAFDVSNYVGLAAESPSVLGMVELLRTNKPLGAADDDANGDGEGTAFIFKDGEKSAMESAVSARHLTMSLAGRANNVAPYLADRVSLSGGQRLVDVGGGSGIYSIALLEKNPGLTAIVWDRPEVLKVAEEMAQKFGVRDRLECVPGDMFTDPLPTGCDVILLSNILHDWDEPECERLVQKCAAALPADGTLLIHDVFLNHDLGGPLPIALYSAALFSLTEGRAYSTAEYRGWTTKAGMTSEDVIPTFIHCGVLPCRK